MGAALHSLLLGLAALMAGVRLFDQSQALYIRALNAQPEGIGLCRVYVGLAHTEFHRGHFLNSRHYAKLCLELMAEGAVDEQEPKALQLLEKASGYYEAAADEARNARRRDLPQ